MASLQRLRKSRLLLPDHVGGRIKTALEQDGSVLSERAWTRLAPRIRVYCLTVPAQDAILLIELGDTIVANLNDTADCGWAGTVPWRFAATLGCGGRVSKGSRGLSP